MSNTNNLKFKLIAKVIRFYGSNAQERALADAILSISGLTIEEAKQYDIDELEQIFANALSRFDEVPLPPRGKDKNPRGRKPRVVEEKEKEVAVNESEEG